MSLTATTDDARAALGLRRYFLRKYHAGQALRVFDVAHAPGDLWAALRQEFSCDTYWQIPAKPKKGFPKIDPAGVLTQEGWQENVLDLHMKRSPWPAWCECLKHIRQPTTIFLTIGRYRDGDELVLSVLGCQNLNVPLPLAKKMQPAAVPYFLHLAVEAGLTVVEAGEVTGFGSTRLIGLHLVPPGTIAGSADAAGSDCARATAKNDPTDRPDPSDPSASSDDGVPSADPNNNPGPLVAPSEAISAEASPAAPGGEVLPAAQSAAPRRRKSAAPITKTSKHLPPHE